MRIFKPLTMLLVEWVDATSTDEWTDLEELKAYKPHIVKSVGWLLLDDNKNLYMTLNLDDNSNNASCSIVIPKSCIKKIKELHIKK